MADMQAMLRVRAALTTCQFTLNRYYSERSDLIEALGAVPELSSIALPRRGTTQDQWLEAVHRAVQEHLPDVPTG